MRVAYRRDCIKLRNRSNLNKAVGRVPAAFVFLICWCSWIELFDGRHGHSFFAHDSLAVAKLSINSVFWILMAKRHGVGVDDNDDIGKGVENGTSRNVVGREP